MAHGPTYRVPLRRKREGKTDYKKRIRLLTSGLPRAVLRRTMRGTIVQFVTYTNGTDRIITQANSRELKKFGWTLPSANTPAAYLTGYLAGKRAVAAGITQAVADLGRFSPVQGSKLFASIKGMIDAGCEIPQSEETFPANERINGSYLGGDVSKTFEDVKNKMEDVK